MSSAASSVLQLSRTHRCPRGELELVFIIDQLPRSFPSTVFLGNGLLVLVLVVVHVHSPSAFVYSRVQSRSAFTVSRDTKPVRDIPVPLCFLLAVALFALSCCCAWPLTLPALLLSTAVCTASLMGPCFLGRRPAGLGLCSAWKCRCLCSSGLCSAWACAGRGLAVAGCMAPGPAPFHNAGARQVQWLQFPQKPGVGFGFG